MANINKIKLSGTTYNIQDENATKTVELTQAQYDALSVKDPNTFYIITDATAGDLSNYYTKLETDDLLDTKLDASAYTPTDLSNYYTKSETSGATEISTALASKADTATTYTKTEVDNAITAATSAKQDTLVSGTNIKTINNESILGSGNITIEGGGSSYTAGDGIDITNDVISVTGKVDTTAFTAHTADTVIHVTSAEKAAWNGKQDTLVSGTNIKTINNESILGSGNIEIQGGGKAVSAGTNISITTGETADTINCTVPYNKLDGSENYSIYGRTYFLSTKNKVYDAEQTLFIGESNEVKGNSASRTYNRNCVIGYDNKINAHIKNYSKGYNVVIGDHNTLSGTDLSYSYVIGKNNSGYTSNTLLIGWYNQAYNGYESALGKYNASNTGSTNDDMSLFSVGNGTSDSARHNAFEIRQNGDIYLTKDGQDVKLQDQLGGSSITVDTALDSGSTNPVENRVIYNKIDEVEQVTARALNELNDRLSEDEEVTAAGLNAVNDNFGGLKLMKISQTDYDNLQVKDQNTLYIIDN